VLNKDGLGGAHDRIILFTERNPVNFDCVHLSTESTLSLDCFFFFSECVCRRGGGFDDRARVLGAQCLN
jgi:hypothetical protein